MLFRMTTAFTDGDKFVNFTRDKDVRSWYKAGSSLIRYAKRNSIYLTLTIEDVHTCEVLLRFYHMPYGGTPIARLNGGCKYGGQLKQGITF